MKILVSYVFHEYNERVEMFIQNAIFKDESVDFLIICNNEDLVLNNIPDYVKMINRPNIGWDFGGWSYGLLTDDLYKKYDAFIFVNSTVIGPFLPLYYTGKWTDIFINGLSETVKLFGSTINSSYANVCDPIIYSHIQSYIFSMDRVALEYLINEEIFSITNYAKNFTEAVIYKEIKMSRKIISNNWNIGCLMTLYKDIDFRFKEKGPSHYKITFLKDIVTQEDYNKNILNCYEVAFTKGNRITLK
jgi:hypothetical protein